MMKFELKKNDFSKVSKEKYDALIFLVTEDYKAIPNAFSKFVESALKKGDLSSKNNTLSTYHQPDVAARWSVLSFVASLTPSSIRTALASAFAAIKNIDPTRVAIVVDCNLSGQSLYAAIQGIAAKNYVYTTTKSKPADKTITNVTFFAENSQDLENSFAQAVATVEGAEFAKEWANRPANFATPTLLAEAAKNLAKATPTMRCEVLDLKDVQKLKMGSFMAVSQGSAEPLKFIVIHYQGGHANEQPIALVGKGVTFDSGGISLKPGEKMDEMKFDMGGAASVLGTFKALSILRPNLNVVGIIPACENLPGPTAVKPGDVVTSMSGRTIEILNTDAEGRLILCDALTYTQQKLKPSLIIDIATLTGACIIALGHLRSGMYSNNETLASDLYACGQETLDYCWRMPLDDEYIEGMKSNFADIANIADRAAGSVTAAKFLQSFIANDMPWAHLDIAGAAWGGGGLSKGATGRPVGLLVDFLCKKAMQKKPVSPSTATLKKAAPTKTPKASKVASKKTAAKK